MQVYSFVAMSAIRSFSGDAKDFFNYLKDNEAFPADTQNLIGKSLAFQCLRLGSRR
jgi:xyloglucan-specific endo-beta-1,4-glucanase